MARSPVKKVSVAKPVCTEPCDQGARTFVMFSRDQATALLNHLSHARDKLTDDERRDFDKGPLGQLLRNLRGG